jgi:DNA-binding beta-propeller fold protein YncE
MKRRTWLVLAASGLAAFALVVPAQAQQGGTDPASVLAREEFPRGVQAHNRYAFNEAILSFEKALSFRNGEPLLLDWLGRAYYRSGIEDTALRQWRAALAAYDPTSAEGLLLGSRVETVGNRRSLYPVLDENVRYVEAGRYPGRNGEITVYGKPTSVLPLGDGSVWVVAYGTNEVVLIDPNGIVRRRLRGPLNGFDRPYDIAQGIGGRLYVSEYKGSRISILDSRGEWKSSFGSSGRGEGQFVGPQNLATDEEGYLYVVDYGNRRVSKFDPEGKFVLAFGGKAGDFPGLRTPTGIASRGGEVFVADAALRHIARFDRSGNYVGLLAEGALQYPESLRFDADGRLVVADTKAVMLVDPATGSVRELGGLGNANVRIVAADVDGNGNIVAANFSAGEVSVMARMDDLSAGLFVQIERVVVDRFPEVTVELRVQDRRRRPVVGLESRNFLLTEEGKPAANQAFLGSAQLSRKLDIALLVERSEATAGLGSDIAAAVRDAASAADRVVALVSAGEQPVKENLGNPQLLSQGARGKSGAYGPRWKFDLGLRLAATELLAGEKKRAVIFVTSGRLGERAFDRYGLSELAAYLANNGIIFSAAVLGDAPPDREIVYLCEQTGGKVVPVYRPEGLAPAVAALREAPNGSYALRFTSSLPTDFGRAYLPVEAEAYLLDRSGRDAIGYFPPLE